MKPDILFENKQFLVVNKPAGLVVNKSETIREETLQDQLAKYLRLADGDLGIGDRAGIVHRLDRDTSGVMIVAKTSAAFDYLQNQFKSRKVRKEYVALVHGNIADNQGLVTSSIGRIGKFGKFGIIKGRQLKDENTRARESETEYQVLKRFHFNLNKFSQMIQKSDFAKPRINYLKSQAQNYTLVSVFPKTGRTHQVRVHLKSIGYPVVCDLLYTPSKLLKFDLSWCSRLFLHATKIEFEDPQTHKIVKFESNLPKDLENALSFLTINNSTINN